MSYGLGLLTNQLYRPPAPSGAPTLGFGFAVDGWSGVYEICYILGRIPKKCYSGQAATVIERAPRNASNAIWNRDARQAGAVTEG